MKQVCAEQSSIRLEIVHSAVCGGGDAWFRSVELVVEVRSPIGEKDKLGSLDLAEVSGGALVDAIEESGCGLEDESGLRGKRCVQLWVGTAVSFNKWVQMGALSRRQGRAQRGVMHM